MSGGALHSSRGTIGRATGRTACVPLHKGSDCQERIAMHHDPGTPLPRTPEQIRADLERIRTEDPHGYAAQAARLMYELEQAEKRQHRYAIT